MFQLDVKKAIFYSDSHRKFYIERPSKYVAQGENTVANSRKPFIDLSKVLVFSLRSNL